MHIQRQILEMMADLRTPEREEALHDARLQQRSEQRSKRDSSSSPPPQGSRSEPRARAPAPTMPPLNLQPQTPPPSHNVDSTDAAHSLLAGEIVFEPEAGAPDDGDSGGEEEEHPDVSTTTYTRSRGGGRGGGRGGIRAGVDRFGAKFAAGNGPDSDRLSSTPDYRSYGTDRLSSIPDHHSGDREKKNVRLSSETYDHEDHSSETGTNVETNEYQAERLGLVRSAARSAGARHSHAPRGGNRSFRSFTDESQNDAANKKGLKMQEEDTYDSTFSPTSRAAAMQSLISFATQEDYELKHFDIQAAFVSADIDKDNVYLRCPPGYGGLVERGQCLKLNRSLYGLKQASHLYWKRLQSWMLAHGFEQVDDEGTLFKLERGDNRMLISMYVDDGLSDSWRSIMWTFTSLSLRSFGRHLLSPIKVICIIT
mmetsp:Transcript_42147/g.82458  ORF Transcript_42147/g.82458 Transcript_42147/m.82458 type:complete len:425 (-) Transcript_42147:467-1741(-)